MSAILHELLFSVAFKTFKAWFFLGMLGQLPMIVISRYFRGKRRGNFLVWLSLFASQPLLEVRRWRGRVSDVCVGRTCALLTTMV